MTTTASAGAPAAPSRVRVVVGLGNPGPEYEDTRHNVGWWVVDRFACDHGFGAFERTPGRLEAGGRVGNADVLLFKPRTYMNRSGLALTTLWRIAGFEAVTGLLVVTDDANLEVGRVRFRPGGGAGGHNGLKSISAVLGTTDYARLRIGVGTRPAGIDLSDWVLSPMPADDEEIVVQLLPELSRGVRAWVNEGIEAAMNGFNR